MFRIHFRTGVVLAALTGGPAPAADPRPPNPAPRGPAAAAPAPTLTVAEVVAPAHRDAVSAVLRNPTLSARAAEDEFLAHPAVYDWLLAHPDRAAVAWRRADVPCVPIRALGGGRFEWTDEHGSRVVWEAVGRFPDGVVWLAGGKVKPGALLPMIPVQAVAVLHAPRRAGADAGGAWVRPAVSVQLRTDSRAASAVLRVVGPAAPRLAEQGAEQLLLFFSGIARYMYTHPEKVDALLAPVGGRGE